LPPKSESRGQSREEYLIVSCGFDFDNTYARELEGFYAPSKAAEVPHPKLLRLNRGLAEELGLDPSALSSDQGTAIFAGNELPEGSRPLAQAYAGHQFGSFVPQLGDGRALLLGEVIDRNGKRRDIQLKGSGRTPFSRGGDGKATIGPILREYLISEAMHALGIPTTRALAGVATGEGILREDVLPGAVLTRVAASHIRIGTFQFFAARGETEKVKQLADYSIARHYPELGESDNPYLGLLAAVCDVQATLIARWIHVGFVHGVMNTDNMTISGETIDYGPCAFIDVYDPDAVFSSIDAHGRYAYGKQPLIARWNLARLAETLLPLINADKNRAIQLAGDTVNAFMDRYVACWLDGMRAKLGLVSSEDDDLDLANEFLGALEGQDADYTLTFRRLSQAVQGDDVELRPLLKDPSAYDLWAVRWRARLSRENVGARARAEAMNRVNPIYIPRNHKVEEALASAAEHQTLEPFEALIDVLERPFDEREELKDYASRAPAGSGRYRTFCGT
jgi:uncharacterized protein YdiU (UPF0061 family)